MFFFLWKMIVDFHDNVCDDVGWIVDEVNRIRIIDIN